LGSIGELILGKEGRDKLEQLGRSSGFGRFSSCTTLEKILCKLFVVLLVLIFVLGFRGCSCLFFAGEEPIWLLLAPRDLALPNLLHVWIGHAHVGYSRTG